MKYSMTIVQSDHWKMKYDDTSRTNQNKRNLINMFLEQKLIRAQN